MQYSLLQAEQSQLSQPEICLSFLAVKSALQIKKISLNIPSPLLKAE